MSDDIPPPMTELEGAAVTAHEAYTAYLHAGFTKPEALELVKAMLIAGIQNAQ
ncbi:hypothetical protein ABZ883_04725 [Streptomyces sp. NPDC046977]|uniref:hypothetical protein n=1 Tax=Streptomyces sp. NPDC046977 TaxID=3154703 RepID=UPI0033C8D397